MLPLAQEPPIWDAIVIGAGPAGFFAAIRCAELKPASKILILEKSSQVLSKVRISGGGRCNVTHACYDPAQLVKSYPRGGRELRGLFARFQPSDTIAWFEKRGVPLKTEADGRVFPVSDSSETVVNCLLEQAVENNVAVRTRALVRSVKQMEGGSLFYVDIEAGGNLQARQVLLATGGSRHAFQLAQSLGHTLQPPVPSLFTFTLSDPRLEDLAGVSMDEVLLRLPLYAIEQSGALLITHWGLSGPAVLKLSAWGARPLYASNYRTDLVINWMPGSSVSELYQRFQEVKAQSPNRRVSARSYRDNRSPGRTLPLRLWKRLVYAAGIGEQHTWGDLSRVQLISLTNELSQGNYRICGKGAFKEEFVTCGGVNLKEVDFRTMQSRICPGLYFAGEVLDIDGVTGGFNFQSAWTTGWLAGSALAGV